MPKKAGPSAVQPKAFLEFSNPFSFTVEVDLTNVRWKPKEIEEMQYVACVYTGLRYEIRLKS